MDIEWLRKKCLSWSATSEDIKWGDDLCFLVAGKLFCVANLNAPLQISFQVKEEEYEELSKSAGIIPAPYMARARWIQVHTLNVFNKKQWEFYLKQSYDLKVAKLTKKVRAELGLS